MARQKLIQTTSQYVPVIYAYTTPGYAPHDGWTKIGETSQGAARRIEQQTATADIEYKLEWQANAKYEASDEVFRDHDFHAYLQKKNIERKHRTNANGFVQNTEWFRISPAEAKAMLYEFRENRGILSSLGAIPYSLRAEQQKAIIQTKDYFAENQEKNPEFLWNAKPRFGKTLTSYDLCIKLGAENILIVTQRPAIANSWYSDYAKFFGPESGYYFVSHTDSLKGKPGVLSEDEVIQACINDPNYKGRIEFISLQDLKGSKYFGGAFDKLRHIYKGNPDGTMKGLVWDVLIIDEAHEGVDTYKTDVAFENIARKFTLHLSGTPFKALANEKFESKAIYNWTYADEQKSKREWDGTSVNPYQELPKLNLLTYKMSDVVFEKAATGADFDDDGDNEAYAFDLNEFFKTNNQGNFIHDREVDVFLNALTSQTKFPFSEEYRDELKHTLWILKYVSSAKALYKKLKEHPIFKDYEIVLAAGDGKIEDDTEIDESILKTVTKKSYDKVIKAIKGHDKTITLSVGQLTTGITVPEWTAVMMLSNMQSPAMYMQAAFRAQNPCMFQKDGVGYRKENAYVFDFDPARTLDIFEQFARGLSADTAGDRGDSETRKKRVRELLNFFPVYGEDEDGEMIELDAEKVLSIPRAIHAKEVVRKGFMCNFLFQNISNIFSAPTVVTDILNKLDAAKEPMKVDKDIKQKLNLNDQNEVEIPTETIVGTASDIFGEKIYKEVEEDFSECVNSILKSNKNKDRALEDIKKASHEHVNKIIDEAKGKYGSISKSTKNETSRQVNHEADKEIERQYGNFKIQQAILEDERQKLLKEAAAGNDSFAVTDINQRIDAKQESLLESFNEGLQKIQHDALQNAGNSIVKNIETEKKEKEKTSVEDTIRDHLRGFARTIPSFLMGYGNENTTLECFERIIPPDVFLEVTGITVEDFIFLRDGGDYQNPEKPDETLHFEGHLFDPIVFNDSIKEFLQKRDSLADYFNEKATEDIFDYIPPQKTNQIFTPKNIVKMMVNYQEQESPGCYDDPFHTFIDLYMKSGLFITEIVKRLFNSEKMKQEIPDDDERLVWIFENQVFGLAPTEIIYAIAVHYIFGFAEKRGLKISTEHFKMLDATPYAQGKMDKTLSEKLDELFG